MNFENFIITVLNYLAEDYKPAVKHEFIRNCVKAYLEGQNESTH